MVSTSGKYLYSVARPIPASVAIADIVTDVSPRSVTSRAAASRVASRTAWRCSATVSVHSFGTRPVYRHRIRGDMIMTVRLDRDMLYR